MPANSDALIAKLESLRYGIALLIVVVQRHELTPRTMNLQVEDFEDPEESASTGEITEPHPAGGGPSP